MKSLKSGNLIIPLMICLCGWLFGAGAYQLMRPALLEAITTSGVLSDLTGKNTSVHSGVLPQVITPPHVENSVYFYKYEMRTRESVKLIQV